MNVANMVELYQLLKTRRRDLPLLKSGYGVRTFVNPKDPKRTPYLYRDGEYYDSFPMSPAFAGTCIGDPTSVFFIQDSDFSDIRPNKDGYRQICWVKYVRRVYGLSLSEPDYMMMDGCQWQSRTWDTRESQMARIRYALENRGLLTLDQVLAFTADPAKYQTEIGLVQDEEI